jgi:hypothetical protein
MAPYYYIAVIFMTGTCKSIEVKLADEGAIIAVFEVLRQVLLSKSGLIIDIKGASVWREAYNSRVYLGNVGYK